MNNDLEFEITDVHLNLVNSLNISTGDEFFGYDDTEDGLFKYNAITIDTKRQYGNKNILMDMMELIGDTRRLDELTEEDFIEYVKLHKEVALTLQICLRRLSFETGKYTRKSHSAFFWEKVN